MNKYFNSEKCALTERMRYGTIIIYKKEPPQREARFSRGMMRDIKLYKMQILYNFISCFRRFLP